MIFLNRKTHNTQCLRKGSNRKQKKRPIIKKKENNGTLNKIKYIDLNNQIKRY